MKNQLLRSDICYAFHKTWEGVDLIPMIRLAFPVQLIQTPLLVSNVQVLCISEDVIQAKFSALSSKYGAFQDDVVDMVLVDPAMLLNAPSSTLRSREFKTKGQDPVAWKRFERDHSRASSALLNEDAFSMNRHQHQLSIHEDSPVRYASSGAHGPDSGPPTTDTCSNRNSKKENTKAALKRMLDLADLTSLTLESVVDLWSSDRHIAGMSNWELGERLSALAR